ncbi:MAG: hypothetical protein HY918_05245 [Candidatus Doudnabacteria bacterium]|nr:hypothetical protein [Candidatus Doudnabacteria bacterium]
MNFGQLIAILMTVLLIGGAFPVAAQSQPVSTQTAQPHPGVRVSVEKFPLIPPVPGQRPIYTIGQIVFAAEEIYKSGVNGSFVKAFGQAKSHVEQAQAIISFASKELLAQLEEMKKSPEGPLPEPEQYQALKDPKVALDYAAVKQSFVPFSEWGESPFGEEVTDWKGLCETYQDTMAAMIQRTNYSPAMKVEWADALAHVCANGLDGRYSKVVDLVDWPLWQWTTGRTVGTSHSGNRIPGVNVMYVGGHASALYLYLPKSATVVMHGFKCKGNPIVPFVIGSFQVTKETTRIPACLGLNGDSGFVQTGKTVRFSAHFDNPAGVPFDFRFILTDKRTSKTKVLGENQPEVTLEQKEAGEYEVSVTGEFEGKPIPALGCVMAITFVKPIPPPPPTFVTTTPPPTRPAIVPPPPKKGGHGWIWVLVAAGAGAGIGLALMGGGIRKDPATAAGTGWRP